MKLTIEQCLERIKKPVNRAAIAQAILQEQRLAMHTEPGMDKSSTPGIDYFLAWVKGMLPADKYARFTQIIGYPLETVDLTERVFEELHKFLDAPDSSSRWDFTIPELKQDFANFEEEIGRTAELWRTEGLAALRNRLNSFVVIDLPAIPRPGATRPEPYAYLLSITSVHDVVKNANDLNKVEYIIFRQGATDLVIIDEVAYRVFRHNKETGDYVFLSEELHSIYSASGELISGLGYVPVCDFWRHTIKGSAGINKRGPLTNALSKLDMLLFKIVGQDYFEAYGSFPVIVKYSKECSYKDESGYSCDGNGFVNYEVTLGNELVSRQKGCPVCAKNSLLGAGSEFTVDPPADNDGFDMMKNPVKFIEPSTDLLEFGVDGIARRKREIIQNTVGFAPAEASKEAINELQVRSQYEAKEAVLNRIREQYEQSLTFALQTKARLRYGRYFISGYERLGTQYFLKTADDLANQYAAAKKAGLPAHALQNIREAYSRTKYKASPMQAERAFLLEQLEPYPDYTAQELISLGIPAIDPIGFLVKVNFTSFIFKFERENLNIVEFGSAIDLSVKISTIISKLNDYGREKQASAPIARPQPGGTGGATS